VSNRNRQKPFPAQEVLQAETEDRKLLKATYYASLSIHLGLYWSQCSARGTLYMDIINQGLA